MLSITLSLDHWSILWHPLIYWLFPLVYFSRYCILQLCFLLFYIFYLFIQLLTKLIHLSLKSCKHFYSHYFELFIGRFAYVFFFLKFCTVLLFEAYSSVSSFCLAFCVCFYELGKIVTLPSLEALAFYTNIPCLDSVPGGFGWLAGWNHSSIAWAQGPWTLHKGHPGGTAGADVAQVRGKGDSKHSTQEALWWDCWS